MATATSPAGQSPEAAPAPAPAAIKPAAVKPWQSPADLPRGAWYRGIGPSHLRDVTTWRQVEAVDPPWLRIGGEWFTPGELLTRFEWTADPYPPSPLCRPCGVQADPIASGNGAAR